MTYRARSVVLGNLSGCPFTGYVLASRTEPDRSLLLDREASRVWVAPGENLRRRLVEQPFRASTDLYPCLIGFPDRDGNPAAVAFNGRMSQRIEDMMRMRGETPESSMSRVLEVFPPKPDDPRVGAVAVIKGNGLVTFHLGVYDLKPGENYMGVREVNVGDGEAIFVSSADCRAIQTIHLDMCDGPGKLAHQLFDKVLGDPDEAGCGAAVCVQYYERFDFGVWNKDKDSGQLRLSLG